jgi:hypothetical protein
LIGTTLGAKSGSSDFLTTRFTKGHEEVPPEDHLGWSVTKRLTVRNEISKVGPAGECPSSSTLIELMLSASAIIKT